MITNDEAAAVTTTDIASESSRLVNKSDLNATNNRKKKLKMGVAAAAAAASILIFGGTITTATFSSSLSSVEMNTLRTSTSTNTNTTMNIADKTTTSNIEGCCAVPSGNAVYGNELFEDCYCSNCGLFDSDDDSNTNWCWSKKYFNAKGDSKSCKPHGDGWDSTDSGTRDNCGPPCAKFESNLPTC
mmetsp:Transcript_1949/g.2130  ORF Transcript_1949/g.2130 Transcript_1949/m.2130 type:complete len:186 (-) Transcript_1949:60-617(-)|eukprot:CAMPEP_0170816164 /NCGR_PEP_ID=MMETSP0733-20121128/39039_1 /TAXON_ID=186038 /ORGANISM="Fragilariopsis kerguelensis, Strain L26-C5" /LENGTH=185 /DNA_ID=CAMNT_0011175157 /DNA_START=26 /DNA_END=583 /DNA_ORIENTATION=-